MRHLRLLALLAPAVLLIPIVACESSSSGTPTPFTFEAGPGFEAGPTPEAGPLPEAGDVDAADAFVPPVPKGVAVSVFDNALPKAGVRVISHDATGAVIADVKTDATGKVTMATAPSMVTVLTMRNGTPNPVTFLAVADGDRLTVQVPGIQQEQSSIGSYSLTFTPGLGGQSPNANVTVGKGCGNSTIDTSMPLVVSLFPFCTGASNAILADGSNGQGIRDGFSFKKGVALPAANATSNVVLPAWTAPGATTVTATVPSGSSSNTSAVYMIADGTAFSTGLAPGSGQQPSAQGGQTFQTATGFAEAYQTIVRTVDDVSAVAVSSIIRRETAPATATTTLPDFDVRTTGLPYVTNAVVNTSTPARPVVTFTSDTPLTAIDGGIVVLSAMSTSEGAVTWTFVVPASAAATFTAPALPTDADAMLFTPLGINTSVNHAVFFEATLVPGYKETKLIPIVPGATLDLLDPSLPLPLNGTVRLTTWQPPPL